MALIHSIRSIRSRFVASILRNFPFNLTQLSESIQFFESSRNLVFVKILLLPFRSLDAQDGITLYKHLAENGRNIIFRMKLVEQTLLHS